MDNMIGWGHLKGEATTRSMSQTEIAELNAQVEREGMFLKDLTAELGKRMIGQTAMVDRVLVALLADGHILLEGVPGLAKTLLVKTLAQAIHADFSRLQFTPDLLPADLLGTQIYNPKNSEFSIHKGPIFANIVLADEINRAPAKVQSALLEAMQERQVTIADQTFPLDNPFLVLATQNPVEHEGTYPLPEAQVDRFMLKVVVDYPTRDEERRIVALMAVGEPEPVRPVVHLETILKAREAVRRIYVDERITEYVLDLVLASRDPAAFGMADLKGYIAYGASPRASIYLVTAARAHAFLRGRGYVTPDDVKAIAPDILRHRVITTYEAEASDVDGSELVQRILDGIEVP
jgi:MoxR-like ATPase